MPAGRRAHTDPPERLLVYVPTSVLTRIDSALVDPVRGRAVYGARSKLVTKLLRNWLDDLEKGKVKVREFVGDSQ